MTKQSTLKQAKHTLYNRKVGVFLAFLLLALIVWFMNKLSYDYVNVVEYPVELYSTKHTRQIFEQTNNTLTVQLKMSGFDILKSRVAKPPVLRIGIDNDRYNKLSNRSNSFYVLSSNLSDAISDQLGDNQKVMSVSPDTLFFKIKRFKEKKVPVAAQLELKIEKEYMLKGAVKLTPDSVVISGDSASLSKITSVSTKPKTIEKVAQPVEGNLELVPLPTKNMYVSQTKIGYSADVVRYTEGSIKVPIRIQNLPVGTELMLLPPEVEVKYRAAISDFASINASQLMLAVNYNEIREDNNDKQLKVYVIQQPKNMLEVTLSNPFVEFIIHKNGHD